MAPKSYPAFSAMGVSTAARETSAHYLSVDLGRSANDGPLSRDLRYACRWRDAGVAVADVVNEPTGNECGKALARPRRTLRPISNMKRRGGHGRPGAGIQDIIAG
jgi:hypothetical protein